MNAKKSVRKLSVKSVRTIILVFFVLIIFVGNTYARFKPLYTYYNFTYGARASSMGNAFTGVADDLSAVFTNPAGIAEFETPQLYVNMRSDSLNYSHLTETDTSGTNPEKYTYQLNSKLKMFDNVAVSAPINIWDMKWTLAISYNRNIPYGFKGQLKQELETTGTGWVHTDTTWTEMKGSSGIDVLAFTGAFYLLNELSFGITYQKYLNSGDIDYSSTGPGISYTQNYSDKISGGNFILGLLLKLSKDISIGLTYRTKSNVTFNSEYTYENIAQPAAPVTTIANTTLTLPPQLAGGVMIKPVKNLKLSIDASYIFWKKATLKNYFGWTTDKQFPVKDHFSFSQKDNINTRFGGEYMLPLKKIALFLRAGLFNDKQLFVDTANNQVKVKGYSFGIGADISSRISIDLAYMRQKSTWNETGYFNTLETVSTRYKNKILQLGVTFNFGKFKTL